MISSASEDRSRIGLFAPRRACRPDKKATASLCRASKSRRTSKDETAGVWFLDFGFDFTWQYTHTIPLSHIHFISLSPWASSIIFSCPFLRADSKEFYNSTWLKWSWDMGGQLLHNLEWFGWVETKSNFFCCQVHAHTREHSHKSQHSHTTHTPLTKTK